VLGAGDGRLAVGEPRLLGGRAALDPPGEGLPQRLLQARPRPRSSRLPQPLRNLLLLSQAPGDRSGEVHSHQVSLVSSTEIIA
jgi:hypothetical protein